MAEMTLLHLKSQHGVRVHLWWEIEARLSMDLHEVWRERSHELTLDAVVEVRHKKWRRVMLRNIGWPRGLSWLPWQSHLDTGLAGISQRVVGREHHGI
jgi:hypothetical protein